MLGITTRARTAALAAALGVALGAVTGPAVAQSTGTLRGSVVEAETMRPMSGVQIIVEGTGRGGLTNSKGQFLIFNVPAGTHTVRATMIGYAPREQTVTVSEGQTVAVEFELAQQAVSIDEIVVTGTAGEVSKRTLGNAITTVDAGDIVEQTTINTVEGLFQARAPGLSLIGGSGTVGASRSIRIRGVNSLVAGNNPVIYIDGVRVHSGHAGNWSNMWCASCVGALGGQESNALSQLNPEDIKSIEVIKGPAAATLYGADAAAGVIQIITKKGAPGQQDLQWNAKVSMGQVDWAVDAVRNYTTCTQERIDARLDNGEPEWIGCQGKAPGTVIDYSGLRDNPYGLRAGAVRNYSLSVRGGGDGYSFYVAGDRDYEEGVFMNNFMGRNSVRANFAFYPAENLDFNVNFGYNKTHTRFPTNDNGGGGLVISAAMWRPGYNYKADLGLTDEEYQKLRGFAWNSPENANEYNNQLWAERVTIGSTVNYRPFAWFKNRLTVGLDNNQRLARKYAAPNSAFSSEGHIFERRPQDLIYTVDYVGTIETPLTDALTSNLSFGTQYIRNYYHDTRAYGYGFGSPLNQMVNQAAETSAYDSEVRTASLGLFVQEQIGWNDRLFLTGAVRMDNNSVFGADIERIFYPKAMASYIISEEDFFDLPAVDELKLRMAFGQAGSAPGAFDAARTYTAGVATLADGTTVPSLRLSAYGNPDLKPEKGEELELGFDASLFNNRLGLELTYYNQHMRDAIMVVPVAPSTGFVGSQYQNLGETMNQGFEVTLTGTPVQSRAFTWDTRLSLFTNKNELVSFGYERDPILMGFYGQPQQHRPGYPLAAFWARRFVRTADGGYARDDQGRLMLEDTVSYIGPSMPTREVSFSNTFTIFGDLQLYVLFNYKGGHYQYDYKTLNRCWNDRCWQTNDPDASELDLELAGDPAVRAEKGYAGSIYDWKVSYITKADFVKLRDVSLSYRLPDEWIAGIGADRASITLAGHDLFVWAPYYTGPDPEVNFYGDHEFWRIDSWTAPMLRRLSASLNVSF